MTNIEYLNVTLQGFDPEYPVCNESTEWDVIVQPAIKTGGCSCCVEVRALSEVSTEELMAILYNLAEAGKMLSVIIMDRAVAAQ